MFPLIDNTAKDFVVRIKELLEAKYKESSKENGLHNVGNNSFSNVNTNKESESSKESQKELQKDDKVTNDEVASAHVNGALSNNTTSKLTLVNSKEINKIVNRSEYNVSQVENKINGKLTDTNHNIKEYKYINEKRVIHNEENKENHCDTNELRKEHTNKNGISLAESKTTTLKLNSPETVLRHTNGNVLKEIIKIKEEIHDIGDISADVDSEKLVGGYTADAIVPCAFGLKSNVMYNDEDPFAVALQAFYAMSAFNIFEK